MTITDNENKSEVAQLLKQIAEEYEAAQRGVQGLAATARHEFVRQRMLRCQEKFDELTTLVDPSEAVALVANALGFSPAPQPAVSDTATPKNENS